jgi:hypothetical protein
MNLPGFSAETSLRAGPAALRVDVAESPFLVTKMSPYYDR